MDRWTGKLAIVTGVTSGIGKAIAKTLVLQGVNVLGLARREDRLKELSECVKGSRGSFYHIQCDLENENNILQAFDYAEKNLGGVDILINNAGVIKLSDFENVLTENIHTMMNVNVIAAAICCRESLKSMRKHNKIGHIINIVSIFGRNSKSQTATIPLNLYPASKLAMSGMTENLRLDIAARKDNIRVTAIYPGLVKTEFVVKDLSQFDKTFGAHPHLQTDDIANSIVYVLSLPHNVEIQDLVITPLHEAA